MKRLLGVLLLMILLTVVVMNAKAGEHKRRGSNLSRTQRHELKERRKHKRSTFGQARRTIFGQQPATACPGKKTCAAR